MTGGKPMSRLRGTWIVALSVLVHGAAHAQQPEQKKNAIAERAARYPQANPATGTVAPLFALADLEGKRVDVKELIGKRPIVIEFGSYT